MFLDDGFVLAREPRLLLGEALGSRPSPSPPVPGRAPRGDGPWRPRSRDEAPRACESCSFLSSPSRVETACSRSRCACSAASLRALLLRGFARGPGRLRRVLGRGGDSGLLRRFGLLERRLVGRDEIGFLRVACREIRLMLALRLDELGRLPVELALELLALALEVFGALGGLFLVRLRAVELARRRRSSASRAR